MSQEQTITEMVVERQRATERQIPTLRVVAALAGLLVAVSVALAQPIRITDSVDSSKTKVLVGNRSRNARIQDDQGRLDPFQRITGITLVFKPSSTQAANLDELLQQQRDSASPNYRGWLTPDQYADRFGLNQTDLDKVTLWLEAEGFSIDYVARGRMWIMFSGTAGQVSTTFHTELHQYLLQGKPHYANATDPSVPAALAPLVLLIRGLDDFRPEPRGFKSIPVPDFTSSGGHSLVPGDIATIYDIRPLYQAGINGSGQKIAVVGQTDIYLSDIEHFRSEFGLPANDPQLVLITGSADPGVSSDDLIESDLDLEYSGGVAPGATILFVYSTSVFNSVAFAVDQDLAPVITMSYGYCEAQISDAPSSTAAYFRSLAQQANSMGITWLASSGDTGAAACDSTSEQVATQGLAVNLPASVPEITAVGGTEFMDGIGTYWSSTNNSNGSSALSYIPEKAWNDTSVAGVLLAGGGGASIFFAKPAWQTGAGVPNDNARDLPDISFSAGIHDPYQIYANGETSYVGGTSASSPVFSGALALLNQYLIMNGTQTKPGLGNINPTLYRLAGTPGVFHDVTVGNNIVPCANGSPNCSAGELGYNAGAGYDQATGLGSADVLKLVTLWNSSSVLSTTTTVSASLNSIPESGSTVLTATVIAALGIVSPTGSVSFTAGHTMLGTAQLSGSNGKATASLSVNGSQLAVGANAITATYSGSILFTGSSGGVSVAVAGATVSAVSVTPSSGSGITQTFAFTVSDSAGASDISGVQAGFNTAPNGANACWMYYVVGTQTIYLANNAGSFASGGFALGNSGTLTNSQCTVNVSASSQSETGNTLTLKVSLTFTSGFAGTKNIYLWATDGTVSSVVIQEGSWTVPAGASGPSPVSVTPSSGSGTTQTFAFLATDPAGASDISGLQAGFNTAPNGTNACWMYYVVGTQTIYLANNSGAFSSGGLPLGNSGTLQNSQCTVNVSGSSQSQSGNTLTLNVSLTFAAGFAGTKNIYLWATNGSESSAITLEGNWTVP